MVRFGPAVSVLPAVMVKLLVATSAVEDESFTVAIKPPVPRKLAVPERVPVLASIDRPSTNDVVAPMGAMLQCKAPLPPVACRVKE